jgi:hypothetical protein
MIQTPLVCLVAIGMWLLVSGVRDNDRTIAVISARLSRISRFLFMVYYTVLDSIGGIGLGKAIAITNYYASEAAGVKQFSSKQLAAVETV